jgi:hypothetical protein
MFGTELKEINRMSKVIGFTGKKGVGKDTAAEFFLENGYAHVKFARPLKEIVAKSFGIPMRYLEQAEFKDKEFPTPFKPTGGTTSRLIQHLGKYKYALHKKVKRDAIKKELDRTFKTPREILQIVGTDIARNICSDTYWTDLTRETIKGWLIRDIPVVITDVRFQNEADLIKEFEGQLIEITRNTEKSEDSHVSENNILDSNGKVCNNGSIEELNKELKELL